MKPELGQKVYVKYGNDIYEETVMAVGRIHLRQLEALFQRLQQNVGVYVQGNKRTVPVRR